MIRSDEWLHKNAEKLNIDPDNINPASVDVCLGHEIVQYADTNLKLTNVDVATFELNNNERFWLLPGYDYLIHTKEFVKCPQDHAWMLTLKSSSGRKGIFMTHMGWGDPGFEGQITFRIRVHRPVEFQVGDRIGQVIFLKLDKRAKKGYGETGKYQGSQGATGAK